MKLNIDTVVKLLAVIEESADYPDPIVSDDIQLTGIDPVTAVYHLSLMVEAGLIRGKEHSNRGGGYVVVERLTLEGHAFLANAQNKTAWERFKAMSWEMGSVSLEVAKTTLAGIAHQSAMEAASNML